MKVANSVSTYSIHRMEQEKCKIHVGYIMTRLCMRFTVALMGGGGS